MKKVIICLTFLFILSGCGKTTEPTTEATTEAAAVTTEESTRHEFTYDELMKASMADYPDDAFNNIKECVTVDIDGVFTVSCDIKDAGKMGIVADYITQSVADVGKDFEQYDILITYVDEAGWVCTWHSYDNKTGILINTLSNYTEKDVTVETLYKWNNGEMQ